MNTMLRQLITVLGMAIALCASGCGDKDPAVPPATTAEGLWLGTTNTNRTLTAAVLDDGTYYFFYSVAATPAQIAGIIQGTGASNDGSFTSSNAKDFGIGVAVLDATLSATYAARQSLNGSITYPGASGVTFTSSYNSAYDTTPTVASLAGVYTGQLGDSHEFWYVNDDGQIVAARYDDWKVVFLENRGIAFGVWREPFIELRVPLLFNLRRDPLERAQHNSNTYNDWFLDRPFVIVPIQGLAAKFLMTMKEYPPSQTPGSFNLSKVEEMLRNTGAGK